MQIVAVGNIEGGVGKATARAPGGYAPRCTAGRVCEFLWREIAGGIG